MAKSKAKHIRSMADLGDYLIPDSINAETVELFISYRVGWDNKLTLSALKLSLNACVHAEKWGHDANAVLEHVMHMGWIGCQKRWVANFNKHGLIKNPEPPPANIPIESPGNSVGVDYADNSWAAGMELAPNKKEH